MSEALKRLYACIRVNRYTCREATLRVTCLTISNLQWNLLLTS